MKKHWRSQELIPHVRESWPQSRDADIQQSFRMVRLSRV